MAEPLNDEEIEYYNKYGARPEWLEQASPYDKTQESSGTARFCQQIPKWEGPSLP